MKRNYKEISPIDKSEAIRAFSSKEKEKIVYALVSISLYELDWKWAQDWCLFYLSNAEDYDISGLAATCLGHIARVNRNLEKGKVISELRKKLNDENIKGMVEDALDDIEMFLPSSTN
jgi:hypothetical protein